jgi:hypothetical protein
MAKITQGLKGMMLKKEFVLSIESCFFILFHTFFLKVLHDVTFNVTTTI